MYEHKGIIKLLTAVIAVAIVLGLAAGVRSFRGGNLQHAQQIASRLQAAAVANSTPTSAVAGSAPSAASTSVAPSTPSTSATSAAASNTTGPAATSSAPGTTTHAPASTVAHAPVTSSPAPSTSSPAATSAPPAVSTVPAAPTAAPRRQPTSAELSQAISAVHSLVPFFTPTVAELAASGNQVCTALDQGVSFSQVKAQALNMVGAGSLSWMIPSSVPDTAVRTLVALYCPANAAKLV